MNKKLLAALWGAMFVLCAGLGFVVLPEEGATAARAGLLIAAVLFFVPGALLLRGAVKTRDKALLIIIRDLAAASLIGTTVLICLNILSVFAPETLGNILHIVLTIVSVPLACAQQGAVGALSLFFWACLLIASIGALKRIRK